MLNTWGYYVEYADNSTTRPSFVASPARKRFRLMEVMQPSESLSLYTYTSGPDGNSGSSYTNWFTDPLVLTGAASIRASAASIRAIARVLRSAAMTPVLPQ